MIISPGGQILIDKDQAVVFLLENGWKRDMKLKDGFVDPRDKRVSMEWDKAFDLQRKRIKDKDELIRKVRQFLDGLERNRKG